MAVGRAAKHLLRNGSKQLALQSGREPVVLRSARAKTEAKKKKPPYPVRVPESREYYDTANLKVAVGMVAGIVLAKLTMMYDESLEPERIERQAKEFAEVQANIKPLSREQWDEIQELRPRTPFESKIGRPHARIRSGEPASLEDIKDWAIDVLMEAMTRKEESLRT